MNLSLIDTDGSALWSANSRFWQTAARVVAPAFTDAAEPKLANRLYEHYAESLRARGIRVEQGTFAANMKVTLVNDGPVTMVIDRDS